MWKLLLTTTAINVFAGFVWGAAGFWLALLLVLVVVFGWIVTQQMYLRVPEMQVAVVYNTESQAFARFLPPGRYWLLPFVEQVRATISTAPETVQGRSANLQASGGISLAVDWTMSYNLNPLKISAETAPKAARTLPRKAASVAQKHMNNCLQHIVSEYTIDQLCRPGVHKRLEREARQLIAERLAFMGFEVSRVMIGAIELPAHVKAAFAAAQERQLQVEQEAKALASLHKVISQFSDADMQRLIELERIHVLGQNGVTLLYPAALERETASRAMNSYTRFAASSAVVAPGLS